MPKATTDQPEDGPPTNSDPRTTTMPSTIAAISRALAIALTAILFVAGRFPAAGLAFPGVAHWTVHFSAYAVIAFAGALGWQKQPAILIAVFVGALGAIHEYTETFAHHHALEIADILVNSVGAGIGVALMRAIVLVKARS